MIPRKTVLVLGAGASMPYGFPSGMGLTNQIILPLKQDMPHGVRQNIKYITPEHLTALEIGVKHFETFQQSLARSALSIDAFIENRSEFKKIGKLAIALVLQQCEDPDRIYLGPKPYFNFDEEPDKPRFRSWYHLLWQHIADAPFSFENYSKNKLSIITFNYDRSLEYFLFNAIKENSDKSNSDCAEKLSSIPIVHVYGSLGPLRELDERLGLPYDKPWDPTYAEFSLEYIHLIRNDKSEKLSGEFEKAYQYLEEAEIIFFLGFGFDKTNLSRLHLEKMTQNKRVTGTAWNLSLRTRKHIDSLQYNQRSRDIFGPHNLYNGCIYDFLHDHFCLT